MIDLCTVWCNRQSSISKNYALQWLLLQYYNFCSIQIHDIENFKTNNKRKLFTQIQNYCK